MIGSSPLISAVLFDKDGTLIDYERSWGATNRRAAAHAAAGDEILEQRLLALGGVDPKTGRTRADSLFAAGNTGEIAASFAEAGSPFPVDELVAALDAIFVAAVDDAVPVGVLTDILGDLRRDGLSLGIASSDSEAAIRAMVHRFAIAEHVAFIAGYDSGHGTKPGPGMVTAFASAIGRPTGEIAVVGDNLHDMRMAAAAGAGLRVAVLTGTGDRDTLSREADRCLPSIHSLHTTLLALMAGPTAAPKATAAPRSAPPAGRRFGAPVLTSHVGGAYLPLDPKAETLATLNPATGEVLAEIAMIGEVEQTVARACDAQPAWGAMTGTERGRILQRVAARLRERNGELALLETLDTGRPIQETVAVDVLSGADCIECFAGLAAELVGEPGAFGLARREPLGVVAAVGAWSHPLQIACRKAAPALAAGNSFIFEPAELSPLTALKLAEIMTDCGVPAGVFNVVLGDRRTGRRLSRHPDISEMSLTGEVGTGKTAMGDASTTPGQVTLELGGKSPLIVFADAELDEAVAGAMLANFSSAGPVCSNGACVFVHDDVRQLFLQRPAERTRALVVGDPADPATQVGALVSEAHMTAVLAFIEDGKRGGATLLCGGNRVTAGSLGRGFFVEPTIFDGCDDDMRIVRERILGPIMTVLPFRDEDEVVARADDARFAPVAGLFTRDLARAHRVVARLKAGTTCIDASTNPSVAVPFGSARDAGLGRKTARAVLLAHTRARSVEGSPGRVDLAC